MKDLLHDTCCAQERNGAIIRAEGESEAAKLISEATRLSGPAFMDLRKIEVSTAH